MDWISLLIHWPIETTGQLRLARDMALQHVVRFGAMGHLGRFHSPDATRYPRGSEVILRTSRGLELGEVLAPPSAEDGSGPADGAILRPVTIEDRLLAQR